MESRNNGARAGLLFLRLGAAGELLFKALP